MKGFEKGQSHYSKYVCTQRGNLTNELLVELLCLGICMGAMFENGIARNNPAGNTNAAFAFN